MRIAHGAQVSDSLITDGCEIASGAVVERSILSPGVRVQPGAVIRESVILTDAVISTGSVVEHAILDKRVYVSELAGGQYGRWSSPTNCNGWQKLPFAG